MSEYFTQIFFESDQRYSVIIEDDSRVAYAYLLFDDKIVSDVWLYNQQEAPKYVDWQNVQNMPFLNPNTFVLDKIAPIKEHEEVEVRWEYVTSNQLMCEIIIRDKLIAKLSPLNKPAWSSLVTVDGPLAKVLQ